jgi:hypothetical protein
MPQPDFLLSPGIYGVFIIHIVGMCYSCAYIVPMITTIAKVYSDRTYYYCVSILEALNTKQHCIDVAGISHSISQGRTMYNFILDSHSMCVVSMKHAIQE